tara:strand:- start:60 stop:293 length:234 start_codon:yes stop_codon:yes gene_type:complete
VLLFFENNLPEVWLYTFTGFLGCRHHNKKSRSWVDSIAAGERAVLPEIFSPNSLVTCLLTRQVTGSPIKLSFRDFFT